MTNYLDPLVIAEAFKLAQKRPFSQQAESRLGQPLAIAGF
jgi:hypothetical protein